MVLRRCSRLLGDEQAARDVMHDVFVQVLSHAGELDDRAPSSLLFRIATNLCLNKLHGGDENPVASILDDYPVALLRRVHMT